MLNHSSFQYITNAVFVDYNNEAVNALNKRIELLGKRAKARSVLGDYNDSASITNELMSQNSNGESHERI